MFSQMSTMPFSPTTSPSWIRRQPGHPIEMPSSLTTPYGHSVRPLRSSHGISMTIGVASG